MSGRLLADLRAMSDESLVEIYGAQYEVTGQHIMDAIKDLMWERHGVAGGTWPVMEREGGGVPYQVVGTCKHCEDAARPPVVASHLDVTIDRRRFHGICCRCGRRGDLSASHQMALRLLWRRQIRQALVWPTRMVNGVPHYVVCRFAPAADDLRHGPSPLGCLCHATYSEHAGEHKLMPAH